MKQLEIKMNTVMETNFTFNFNFNFDFNFNFNFNINVLNWTLKRLFFLLLQIYVRL